jgi:hypothetical protein
MQKLTLVFLLSLELSSESGQQPSPSPHHNGAELREMRLSLLMEIEKRKQAEEALDNMQSQWQRIRQELALVGLSLPACPDDVPESDQPSDVNPVEEICQQIYLARFVSESIGRGIAKAEAEIEMEAQVEAKNFEIARLLDRLHYYEAVNRELSQWNQEVIGEIFVKCSKVLLVNLLIYFQVVLLVE